jgi:hypothetical protein
MGQAGFCQLLLNVNFKIKLTICQLAAMPKDLGSGVRSAIDHLWSAAHVTLITEPGDHPPSHEAHWSCVRHLMSRNDQGLVPQSPPD